MEKETSSLVSLGIVLVAIAVVITLGFGIFAVGKRLANSGQNDLVSQVDQISTSTFTDLDQQVITGTRLKSVVNQLASGNYAVLLATTAFLNSQGDAANVSGGLATEPAGTYYSMHTNYPSETAKGTKIADTVFIDYGALLGESKPITATTSGGKTKLTITKGTLPTKDGTTGKLKDAVDCAVFEDGVFTVEKELLTNAAGVVQRCDQKGDISRQGTTMYVADAAQFNSYCVKDVSGNYVGLAFIQIKR